MSQNSGGAAKPGNPFLHRLVNHRLFIPVILFLLIQGLVALGLFNRAEFMLYDAWYRVSGARPPGDDVVVIAVDTASIDKIGPLAWPRTVHAQLLEKLGQARVVTFDLTFSSGKDQAEDQAFAQAMKKQGRVILPCKFDFATDESGEHVQMLEMPAQVFLQNAAGIGFVNMPTDEDQVVRRSTLVDVNTFDIPLPSLDVATYLIAKDLSPRDVKVSPGRLMIGREAIPIDSQNRAMPLFWGPKETFKTVSYADVLYGKIPPSFFKDKIVYIGSNTQEEHDVYSTPYTTSNMVKHGSPETPGVEIHATILKSMLTSQWFNPVPSGYNLAFLFLAGMLTALLVGRRGPWKGMLGTLLLMAAAIVLTYALWHYHLWIDLAAPLTLILLTYVVVTATDFLQAEMERRRTRATFSRYVSPDVVEQLMQDPDSVELGGKKQVITIMFADIRGFTAYSENKDPVDVINRLNDYLTLMTRTIQKHGGTLDKYLGDGLMAFFGAPIHYEDHVERAVRVAIEIQQGIKDLNQQWAEREGAVPLLVAIGINTGPAVVGNVGSPERMDYTLIGEDVNLASRTEALTKLFQTLVLVSERSYDALPEGDLKSRLQYVGEELVKGFTNPIKVYTVADMDLFFEKSKDKGFK